MEKGSWRPWTGAGVEGDRRGRHLTSATPLTCRTCPRHSPRRHLGTSRSEGQLCAPSDPVTGWTGHRVHPRCLARVTGAYARPSDSGVASVRRHCGDSCKNRPRKPGVRPLPPGEHVHVARAEPPDPIASQRPPHADARSCAHLPGHTCCRTVSKFNLYRQDDFLKTLHKDSYDEG